MQKERRITWEQNLETNYKIVALLNNLENDYMQIFKSAQGHML